MNPASSLEELGFDAGFAAQAAELLQPGQCVARVTAVDRDAFQLRNAEAEVPAELAGRFRFGVESAADLPCVGDWVCAQWPVAGGPGRIHAVLPRRTFLRRKSAGKAVDLQMIAANVDVAFIVQGCTIDFNVARLERYLVTAHEGRIEPRIILSKADLASGAALAQMMDAIRAAGIDAPVLPLSNETGLGLEALRAGIVAGRTYGLLGSSGVGKSTLINRLAGGALATKPVSATGEGVHTTSRRQLLVLEGGGMLIDTPGMRELGLIGAGDGIDATFADLAELAAGCRFPDCTHTHEPGCAVRAAVESGALTGERYRSYLKLRKETAFHDASYAERRHKDRAFGRHVSAVLKHLKK